MTRDTRKPQRVLCAGRTYCDVIFTGTPRLPTLGTETFASALDITAGGGAAIAAATFAALGRDAALLSYLPGAPFDTIVRNIIAQATVDTHLCHPAQPNAAPQITVAIATADDRAFLSHKVGAAIPQVSASDLARFTHMHIGELRTLLEHPELIDMARKAGLTLSLDCGWDDDLMSGHADIAALIAAVDVFLPNEAEAAHLELAGIPAGTAPLTVVKCGSLGARAFDRITWHEQTTLPVNVVDTTGAGDAFNGGFLDAWLSGQSLSACLCQGNRCGAAAVQQQGGLRGLSALRAMAAPTADLVTQDNVP